MGHAFKLTPLVETGRGIFCHLLEAEGCRIVIDCGIGEDFDYSIYDGCLETIRSADCILITSFNIGHLGAVGLFPAQRICCTVPTAILGKIMLADIAEKARQFGGREVLCEFEPEQIKYSQPFKIGALAVCAYNAGHCVGNSAFRISLELQSVVVCYDFNQRCENYLSGLDSKLLRGADALVTNSAYSTARPYTLKSRAEALLQTIKQCKGRVIIAVRFSRLMELLSMIANADVVVVSKYGKLCTDRAKSMLEWASAGTSDIFADATISFGRIDDIGSHKIIVVITEDFKDAYLGTVVHRYNAPKNLLLLVNRAASLFQPAQLKAYKFAYTTVEKPLPKAMPSGVDHLAPEDSEDNAHWSQTADAIFVTGRHQRVLFPQRRRKIYNTDYGEIFPLSFEQKTEQPVQSAPAAVFEEVETHTLVQDGIEPALAIEELSMEGISDFRSSKNTIDGLGPQQLVIVNDNRENASFYFATFGGSAETTRVLFCDAPVGFGSSSGIRKLALAEEVFALKYRNLCGKRVAKFSARREGKVVAVGDAACGPVAIGMLGMLRLKKAFIESGFKVEAHADALLVGRQCRITFNNGSVCVDAQDPDTLVAVRSVLYNHMAII
ncbi:cleavage and polyadenylation specificity factor subunit 2 [Pancytospora philotis]|nr:cleavage and polyadenylation specificity factor subunit 2 [Pancytospora philotis]